MKTPKIFFALAIACFAVALTDDGGAIYYGILRPLTAVLFALALITTFLAKEAALFDEENPEHAAPSPQPSSSRANSPTTGRLTSSPASH